MRHDHCPSVDARSVPLLPNISIDSFSRSLRPCDILKRFRYWRIASAGPLPISSPASSPSLVNAARSVSSPSTAFAKLIWSFLMLSPTVPASTTTATSKSKLKTPQVAERYTQPLRRVACIVDAVLHRTHVSDKRHSSSRCCGDAGGYDAHAAAKGCKLTVASSIAGFFAF